MHADLWRRAPPPLVAGLAVIVVIVVTQVNPGTAGPTGRFAILALLGAAAPLVVLLPGLATLATIRPPRIPGGPVVVVLVGSGLAGWVDFWAWYLSRWVGAAVSVGILVASIVFLAQPLAWSRVASVDVAVPFALFVATSVTYVALAYTSHGLDRPVLAVFDRFWHVGDHWVPKFFADDLVAGRSVKGFVVPDWHYSDRPPLQTGMLLPTYFLTGRRGLAYMGEAVALQTTWVLAAWALVRAHGASIRRATAVVMAIVPSGVLFFNSVYVWPKLLAATYAVCAFALVARRSIAGSEEPLTRITLVGCCLALAMLAHGGSVYAVLALLPFLLRWRRPWLRPALGTLVIVGALATVVYSPWVAFQRHVDPPGDRLVKWHLAGAAGVEDERSTVRAIVDAYTVTDVSEIIANKLENFATLVWHSHYDQIAATEGWKTGSVLGALRVMQLELFVPSTLPMSLALLVLLTRRGRGQGRQLIRGGFWVGTTLVVWCLLQWGTSGARTVVHNGTLAPVVAVLAGCALLAARVSRRIFVSAGLAQLAVFVVLWVVGLIQEPAHPAPRFVYGTDRGALVAFGMGVAALATIGCVVRLAVPRDADEGRSPPAAEPTTTGR